MTAATLSALLSGVVLGAFLLALALAWPSWRDEWRARRVSLNELCDEWGVPRLTTEDLPEYLP